MLYHPCVTQTGTKKQKDLHCKSTGTQELIKRKGKGILGKVRIWAIRYTPMLTEEIRSRSTGGQGEAEVSEVME